LPDLTVQDSRVGQAVFTIRFWRENETTAFEVLSGDASAVIRHDMTAARECSIVDSAEGD
jgi:hypothetical protein